MANSDKNILITPNTGSSTLSPTIVFRGANNTPVTLRTLDTGTISFEGTAGQLFSISDGLSGSIFSVNDISGIPSIEVLDTGLIKLNQYSGSTAFGSSAAIQNSSSVNAKVSISTVFPATPGLIIKGAASQTADLQQWQNSSGTVLAKIKVAGDLLVPTVQDTTSVGPYLQFGANDIFIINTGTAKTNLKIRAIASQTANLTEWQDINNTVLTKVESGGAVNISPTSTPNGYSLYVIGAGSSGIVTMKSTATSAHAIQLQNSANTVVFKMDLEGRIVPSSASSTGLVVRSVASQAGNMQEWQNSSGTVLAAIGPNGTVYMGSNGGANIANFYNGTSGYGAGNIAYNGTFNINGANLGFPYTASGAVLSVNATFAGSVPITARGYASQTANLQEWQNSSGTVLGYINSLGELNTPNIGLAIYGGIYGVGSYMNFNPGDTRIVSGGTSIGNASVTPSAQLQVTNGVASTIAMIVKGAASQTGDLQQWQNSAGTNLVRVSSSGKILIASDGEAPSSMLTISQAATSAVVTSIASTSSDYGLTLNATGSGNNTTVGMAFSAFASTGFNGTSTPGGAIWFTRTGSYSLGYLSFLTRSSTGANDPLVERMRVGDTGTISIAGFAAGSPGLIVKAAVSQTANLQEWQNNSGTVISSISSYGGGRLYDLGIKGSPAGIAWAYFGNDSISTKNVVVRAVASQTANLQEWQDSNGTSLGAFNAFGSLYISNNTESGTAQFGNTGFASASSVVLKVKATASQTANLQEWQNSSGTVLAQIDGQYGTIRSVSGIDLTNTYTGSTTITARVNYPSTIPIIIIGAASQTADLQQWQNSAGAVLAKVNSAGMLVVGNTTGTIQVTSSGTSGSYPSSGAGIELVAGADSGTDLIQAYNRNTNAWRILDVRTAGTNFLSQFASSTVLKVKGYASQTANLQEWQNSAGTVLAGVASNGDFTNNGIFTVYGRFGGASFTDAAALRVNGYSTAVPTAVIKAIASQTANLQEWQNSAGTVLARIDANGLIYLPGGSWHLLNGQETWYKNNTSFWQKGASHTFRRQSDDADLLVIGGNGNTSILLNSASAVGLIVKGAASQTANLQEWQNSAGGIMARMSFNGRLEADWVSASVFRGSYIVSIPDTGPYFLMSSTNTLLENRNTASNIVFTVKGMASQTGNLQEWQNSAGTVLAKVNADGGVNLASGSVDIREGSGNFTIRNAGTTAYFTNSSLLVGTGYSAGIGVIIRGNGSQTADLQQWQNSSGTVLAYTRNDGMIAAQEVRTINNFVMLREENSGGYVNLIKATATNNNPGANQAKLYLRDGTNAGTLKLVVRAGAAGAETTILDNIPQS